MFKRSASGRRRPSGAIADMMEPLENRMMFGVGGSPLPTMDMLESPSNTVVRFQTNYGDIDLEMFDSVAPGTVTNFLKYVKDGDYDQSFFHRLAFTNSNNPFVLQGGGFRFDNAISPAFRQIPTDPAIDNEFGRSNVARTVAMAKLSDPDSATSQFFFNLVDNVFLDDEDNSGGFTVFARVLGEASWNTVLAIQGLARSNISADPAFTGSMFDSNFETTPTTRAYNPAQGVDESLLVRISDAEIVKPGAASGFYNVQVYYPEGFAGSRISEFLPLVNPGDSTLHYQVIVRAETPHGDITTNDGWFRDRVISTGTIGAHSRGGITISQFGANGAPGANDLVPQGVPYAIEVWATSEIAATLSHYDFGTSTGESFTTSPNTTWGFGEITKLNGSVFDFLVWDNPNDVDANLQITFYFSGGVQPVTLNVTTDAYRRGGMAFENLAEIQDNTVFSARIVSDVPIIAALSHFDSRGDQSGSSAIGVAGTPSSVGILPFAQGGADITDMKVTFFNPGNTPTVLSIVAHFENPADDVTLAVGPGSVISGRSRVTIDLDDLLNSRIAAGEIFTIRYRTSPTSTPVYAHASINALGDEVSNPFGTQVANAWLFAEGFMDPARAGDDVLETLSVTNPSNNTASVANVTFSFFYGDGFTLTHTATVNGRGRLDLNLDEFAPILEQATNNGRFYYSVRISADVPIMTQMLHYDQELGGLQASGGFSTLGTPQGTVTRLDQL